MAKYVEMTRRVRVTENRVSKFKNPRVITWHLARKTNKEPLFSIALFKDGRDWVKGPAYSQTETQGYSSLVELLSKMSKLWGLSTDQFYLLGSATYNQETLRADITSSITHETRPKEAE